MTSGPGVAITLVGIVGLLVGVAGAFGFIPGLAVVQTPCGSLTSGFAITQTGNLTLKLTDNAVFPTGASVGKTTDVINFGDSTNQTSTPGSQATHVYTSAGTYTVEQSVTVACKISPFSSPVYGTNATQSVIIVTGPGGGDTLNGTIHADYALSYVDYKVFVNDTSTTSGQTSLGSVSLSWGDGQTSQPNALGFSLSHTYSKVGNYTVLETVKYTSNGTAASSSFSERVNITGSGNGGSGTHFVFNAITGFLIIGFGAMACLGFVVVRFPTYGALAIGIAMVLGFSAGFGIGGW